MRMVAARAGHGAGGDGALSRPVYDVPHAVAALGLEGLGVPVDEVDRGRRAAGRRARRLELGRSLRHGRRPALSLVFLRSRWRCWSSTSSAPTLPLHPAEAELALVAGVGRVDPDGVRRRRRASGCSAGCDGRDRRCSTLRSMPAILLALATAGYSAFLFGQAEGRDFWQSPLVLPHLIVAAVRGRAPRAPVW